MTYRRKPEAEITRIKKSQKRQGLSPLPALWLSLGSALLIFLFVSHFPVRFSAPLGFSLKSLWVALSSGAGIFGFLYAMQVFTRGVTSHEPRAAICSTCLRTAQGAERHCPCGGTYEPIEFYDEVDD